MGEKEKKGAISMEYLVYMLLALAALLFGVGIYLALKGNGSGPLAFMRDLFNFGAG